MWPVPTFVLNWYVLQLICLRAEGNLMICCNLLVWYEYYMKILAGVLIWSRAWNVKRTISVGIEMWNSFLAVFWCFWYLKRLTVQDALSTTMNPLPLSADRSVCKCMVQTSAMFPMNHKIWLVQNAFSGSFIHIKTFHRPRWVFLCLFMNHACSTIII